MTGPCFVQITYVIPVAGVRIKYLARTEGRRPGPTPDNQHLTIL